MEKINLTGIDRFTIQARILPLIVIVLPVCLSVAGLVSPEELKTGILTGSLTGLALMAMIAQLGRDLGKRKEPRLFERWQGTPTTVILRHTTSWLNRETLKRYHGKLSLLFGRPLPTEEDEKMDLQAADSVYESCRDILKEKTRGDQRFGLVHEELINYNFRRNLWGHKPSGILLSTLSIFLPFLGIITSGLWNIYFSKFGAIASIISACFLVLWVFRITPDWVKQAADAYAERLVSSCEKLEVHGVAK